MLFKINRPTLLALTIFAMAAAYAVPVPAQIINSSPSKQVADAEMLKIDLRAQRTEIVAKNMALNEEQAKKFLPIYLDYDSQLQNIWNERIKLILKYATEYATITDAQTDEIVAAMLKLDSDLAKLRKEYYKEFKTALGSKVAARFIQVDRRLGNLLEIQVSKSLPLVQ